MTYDELAALIDCDPAEARAIAHAFPLDRRRSRDGRTRAKLNTTLTDIFIARLSHDRTDRDAAQRRTPADATTEANIDAYVAQLRIMHQRMTGASAHVFLPPPRQQQG
jgi:hypothetical protein